MLSVSWTSRDPFNAEVVDHASGQVIFHLDTPFKIFGTRVTTMTDGQGRVIAEYERRLGYDRVTYQGETHRVSDWLPKNGLFSSARRLRAPDGKTYVWKERMGGKFKLVDARSDAVVARTHAANLGIFSERHNIIIDAGPEIVAFLDVIVLSFVICEGERRARQRNQSAAQMSAMSGAAATSAAAAC